MPEQYHKAVSTPMRRLDRIGITVIASGWDSYSISGDWDFTDLAAIVSGAPLKIEIDGVDLTATVNHQVVFGSRNADNLIPTTLTAASTARTAQATSSLPGTTMIGLWAGWGMTTSTAAMAMFRGGNSTARRISQLHASTTKVVWTNGKSSRQSPGTLGRIKMGAMMRNGLLAISLMVNAGANNLTGNVGANRLVRRRRGGGYRGWRSGNDVLLKAPQQPALPTASRPSPSPSGSHCAASHSSRRAPPRRYTSGASLIRTPAFPATSPEIRALRAARGRFVSPVQVVCPRPHWKRTQLIDRQSINSVSA